MASPTPPTAQDQLVLQLQEQIKELQKQVSVLSSKRDDKPDTSTTRTVPNRSARMGFGRPGPDPRSGGRGINVNRGSYTPRRQSQRIREEAEAINRRKRARKKKRADELEARRPQIMAEREQKKEARRLERVRREMAERRATADREFREQSIRRFTDRLKESQAQGVYTDDDIAAMVKDGRFQEGIERQVFEDQRALHELRQQRVSGGFNTRFGESQRRRFDELSEPFNRLTPDGIENELRMKQGLRKKDTLLESLTSPGRAPLPGSSVGVRMQPIGSEPVGITMDEFDINDLASGGF
jgi:hypothetical protein